MTSKTLPKKRKTSSKCDDEKPPQKRRSNKDFDPRVQQVWPFPFYSVDEQWQRNACAAMGLQFREKARLRPGGPQVPLTSPDLRTVKRIHKDGN